MTNTDRTTSPGNHTPGPWLTGRRLSTSLIITAYGKDIAAVKINRYTDNSINEANARRIVAAVNACEGISTWALEQGVIAELMLQLMVLADHVESQPHEFTEALRKLRVKEARAAIAKAKGAAQ